MVVTRGGSAGDLLVLPAVCGYGLCDRMLDRLDAL